MEDLLGGLRRISLETNMVQQHASLVDKLYHLCNSHNPLANHFHTKTIDNYVPPLTTTIPHGDRGILMHYHALPVTVIEHQPGIQTSFYPHPPTTEHYASRLTFNAAGESVPPLVVTTPPIDSSQDSKSPLLAPLPTLPSLHPSSPAPPFPPSSPSMMDMTFDIGNTSEMLGASSLAMTQIPSSANDPNLDNLETYTMSFTASLTARESPPPPRRILPFPDHPDNKTFFATLSHRFGSGDEAIPQVVDSEPGNQDPTLLGTPPKSSLSHLRVSSPSPATTQKLLYTDHSPSHSSPSID